MSLPKHKAEMTAAILDHIPMPDGQGWHARAVRAAVDRVAQMGMPVARDEYWKYTNPAPFTDVAAGRDTAHAAPDAFGDVEAITLSFVDGVLTSESLPNVGGLEIALLSDAKAKDIHWAADIYGVLETAGHSPVPRPFGALNTAVATQGVLIRVSEQLQRPIRLQYATKGAQVNLHHVIKVETGASVTVLEEGTPGAESTVVIEAVVADNAALKHLRIQPDHDRLAMTNTYAQLGHESAFSSFTLTLDGALTRNECVIDLTADDASAHVAGACLGDGGDFHHDDTVFITHQGANCESRQVFKKVLRNGATGVFQGKILVQQSAQKTDGYQISQSLLLDDDSQFLAKPELEIYADDVACSHGSTSGAIDDDALFYLRSRGVPRGQAEDMLTLSFLAEAVTEIGDERLQDAVMEMLQQAFDGRHG